MKRKTYHRWISMVLAVCMALAMTGGFAFAEDTAGTGAPAAVADSGAVPPVTKADLIAMVNDLRALDLTSKDAVLEKQDAIRAAKDAYAALTPEDRAAFNESAEKARLDELTEALAKFLREDRPELTSDDVGPMLDALTGVSLSDRVDMLAAKAKIVAALKAYRDLTDGEKNYLTEAQRAFAEKLNEALKAYNEKSATPAEITELIARLTETANKGEIPDADAVKAARAAYDALTDEEKAAFDKDALAMLEMIEAALAAATMAGTVTELTDAVTALEPGNTYSVSTPEALNKLSELVKSGSSVTGYIVNLTGNIVANSSFTPIGGTYPGFNGTFNGGGHEVEINITGSDRQGLFGSVGNNGNVNGVGVIGTINATVDAASPINEVGGVVGDNSGTVTNCYSAVTVSVIGTASTSNTASHTGGVVGDNSGTVTNCYNTGDVSGVYNVGGVVGKNTKTVENCYNTGKVTNTERYAGGVVGDNDGNSSVVKNCYNTGTVTGKSTAGGVVSSNDGTVENCYNTGAVESENSVGGVAGTNGSSGKVENCVSLGLSVKKTDYGNDYGRVVSSKYGTLTNNQARKDMLITNTDGTKTVTSTDLTGKDGADIAVGNSTLQSTVFTGWDSAWEIPADGKLTLGAELPILTDITASQTPTLPGAATDAITISYTTTSVTTTKIAGGDTLADAVTKSGVTVDTITSLKITAGEVTADDWKYFAGGNPGTSQSPFTALETFEVDVAVTEVAAMPDTNFAGLFPKSIVSVSIPNITAIEKSAFRECILLTTAKFPAVETIGVQAFYTCSTLQSADIPKATNIGANAFAHCIQLASIDFKDTINIGDYAFRDCAILTDVSFPKATNIGANAFMDCLKLVTASFPKVTDIGGSAFSSCQKLTTLSLPTTPPKSVGAEAFEYVFKERSLKIVDANGNELTGDTLTNAQAAYDAVADGMSGSTATDGKWYGWKVREPVAAAKITITVNGGTAVGGASLSDAVTKSNVAADAIKTLKITAGTMVANDWNYFAGGVPGTTTSPFTALETFEVSDDVDVTDAKYLPNGSASAPIFPGSIKSVNIPTYTYGRYAFFNCPNLTTVKLPKASGISDYMFFRCTALTTVDAPKVETIGESAFEECSELTTLDLPKVTSINKSAFTNCANLTSVSMPKVANISESAFSICRKLAALKLPERAPYAKSTTFFACAPDRSVVIVDENGTPLTGYKLTDAIEDYRHANDDDNTDDFWWGWKLGAAGKITIKLNGGTNEYAGDNLKAALESSGNGFNDPYDPFDTIALNIIAGEVTESDWYTMKDLSPDLGRLETFEIAEGVKVANLPDTEVYYSIFPDSIKTVKIPQITAVGKNVFRFCSALTSVSLPQVTTVGDGAFGDCGDLTTVNMSTATTSIGANAFMGCRSLAELKLGATPPTFVGDRAFQECPRPRYLKLVKPDGTPLTGAELATAQKKYDMAAEYEGTSTATDGLWHGWTIGGGTTAGHVCNGITFDKALPTSGQSLPTGNYYLDGDVNASANFFMPEGTVVNLCLNGHTLTTSNPNDGGTGSKFASMSLNRASTNLNIYDCSADNSGKITGGNGGDGGCIHNSYGTLNLYGGTITGNTATRGGGVYNYSENLTLYGKASITGNTNRAGGASNLYYDRYYPLKVGGKLSGTIGITPSQLPDEYSEARIAIAASGYTLTADDLKCFVSDVAGYEVVQTTYDGKACFSLKKVVAKTAPGGKLEAPLTQDKVDGVFGKDNATLNPDGSITIDNSIIPEKPIEIETDVTIDLGGNTITGKPGQPPVIVGDRDKVTIEGDGTVSGGDNSGGAGGSGITGGKDSEITIGGGVTVEGGDGASGGNGIQSGGNVTVDGSVSGGNGSSGNGGSGVDTSGGSGDITVGGDGTVSGGDSTGGNGNGGNGTNSGGNTVIGGDVSGGTGNGSGSGGNGATDTTGGSGDISVQPGGSAQGGNGGVSGGAGGNGVENNGGGSTTVDGSTSGGNGGNSSSGTGGAGGNGSTSTGNGSIEVGGSSTGGNGGSGSTGGTGGNGTSTGGNTTVTGDGTATGGTGGSGSTSGGNGGNGANSGSTTVNGGATGGSGGSGKPGSNGNGGNGGNGVNQGSGTVEGSGTATGGNGGGNAGTGSGGAGGKGVGGGATAGGNLKTKDGISAKVEVVGDAKTEVKLPDPAKTVDAVLTDAEKADKDITDVKVTLKVDDKTADKPVDAGKAEDVKPANSVIGAFFDITLQKTVTKNDVAGSPETVTDVPNGVVTITIEIPAGMRDGVENSYVVIRVHDGVGEALGTSQSGNELTFETDKFSTYAIAYTKSTTPPPTPPTNNTSGGGGGSSNNSEYDFWMTVREKIQKADSGDVIKVSARGYDKMPVSVMNALRKNDGVSLVITWKGETITIPAGKAQKNESKRIYWPLSKLAELYAGITEDTVLKPADGTNSEMGGSDMLIPVTGGGELITLEAPISTTENTLPDSAGNAQAVASTQPKAVTPPDAGFEQDAFSGTPDTKQATSGNTFVIVALMLAAAAIGSGVWFWKRHKQNG